MTFIPDKLIIKQNFSKAAHEYDMWAGHHKIVAEHLCELIPDNFKPGNILELGCGTGLLTKQLGAKFPGSEITAIDIAPGMIEYCNNNEETKVSALFAEMAAEEYKLNVQVDLVASSLSFQWFSGKETVLNNMAGWILPSGKIALAVPVKGTLPELSFSYHAVKGEDPPGLELWNESQYRKVLKRSGLYITKSRKEDVRMFYSDALTALKAIKYIGASLSPQKKSSPLSISDTRKLLYCYEKKFKKHEGKVGLTYKVLYLIIERS